VEKQAIKMLSKYRDTKRETVRKTAEPGAAPAATKSKAAAKKEKPEKAAKPAKVVKAKASRKPMTAEEAMMTMPGDSDYVVFTDSDTGRTGVLVRRRDGKVDLIES
jgi:hypothetical protein